MPMNVNFLRLRRARFISSSIIKALAGLEDASNFWGYVFDESVCLSSKIISTEIELVFPGINKVEVNLHYTGIRHGYISCHELYVICAIAKYINAQRIFEIGTFDGNTTYNLALNTSPSAKLFTLDLPPDLAQNQSAPDMALMYQSGTITGEKFRGKPIESKISQLWGDSANFDFSPYYDSIDLVFVDGDHSYDYVKSDTINAVKMLRKETGKCIIWHDFPLLGVLSALEDSHVEAVRIEGAKIAVHKA